MGERAALTLRFDEDLDVAAGPVEQRLEALRDDLVQSDATRHEWLRVDDGLLGEPAGTAREPDRADILTPVVLAVGTARAVATGQEGVDRDGARTRPRNTTPGVGAGGTGRPAGARRRRG